MDPVACWKELVQAIEDHDWDTVSERATALKDWVSAGGFIEGIDLQELSTIQRLHLFRVIACGAYFLGDHELS